jgi:hypothetical protein
VDPEENNTTTIVDSEAIISKSSDPVVVEDWLVDWRKKQ